MKLGITGAGLIVQHLLSFIHEVEGITLQAIYARDNKEDRLTKICAEHGIQSYYTDYEEMLADEQIDTIYVAVTNQLHHEFAKKALLRGKHVICEKPFTVELKDFEDLCDVSFAKGVLLIEAITTLYLPNYLEIKEQVKRIGRVRIAECNFSQYSSRYDDFKKGIIKPCFDPVCAGGALMDLNVYNIHLVADLFGEPIRTNYYPNMEKGIDVSGVLVLSYPTFQCVLIGSKDCSAPICTNIQGDQGCIHIPASVNTCDCFEVLMNSQESEQFALNGERHRMYYEFVEFERVVRERDMGFVQRMLKQSRIVMQILEEARKALY